MTATVQKVLALTPTEAELYCAKVGVYIAESDAWRQLVDQHTAQRDACARAACNFLLEGDNDYAMDLAKKYAAEDTVLNRVLADAPVSPSTSL